MLKTLCTAVHLCVLLVKMSIPLSLSIVLGTRLSTGTAVIPGTLWASTVLRQSIPCQGEKVIP